MVDGIQGNSRVDSIKLNNIQKLKKSMVPTFGIFGFGPKTQCPTQIDVLNDKFSFSTPKYHKGIGQLVIKDSDFIPDVTAKEQELCEA